jgi:hypothetical protein
MTALTDRRYGFRWTTDALVEYLNKHLLVQRCFTVEMKALEQTKKDIMGNDENGDCPDSDDCHNQHCTSSRRSQQCIAEATQKPPSFIPLIQNETSNA